MRTPLVSIAAILSSSFVFGCASGSSFVHSDAALGRVVVYRNGVAYFERHAHVSSDTLRLSVPADKIDDFLKSLTVVDARTGQPAPIAYPTAPGAEKTDSGLVDLAIQLPGPAPHDLKISYVTESPSWKPSYRVVLGKDGKVNVQAWAIVDNTSGEDWQAVKLGVGASSALSFRYDLRSIRHVERETLNADDLFAQAPPLGGASHANELDGGKRVLTALDDAALALQSDEPAGEAAYAASPVSGLKKEMRGRARMLEQAQVSVRSAPSKAPPPPPSFSSSRMNAEAMGGIGHGAIAPQEKPKAGDASRQDRDLSSLAQRLRGATGAIVVEGYADPGDADKNASSLARANKVREQLVRSGLAPERVSAVGNGAQAGQAGGVRIVQAPAQTAGDAAKAAGKETPSSAEPIGTSHFESSIPMSVARGTSAMVSILKDDTEGEVVYLYDPETARGNAAFPFRSVRIKNPSDSTLESGPVTVFGDGKFIGEGLAEPIPARSVAFVPFALDRQIVVDHDDGEREEISKILTVQRGVFSTELQHTKKTTLTLHNRLAEKAVVYIRHTVPSGYSLTRSPGLKERLGAAYLFRVEIGANTKLAVDIEEATAVFKTTDIRSPGGMDLIRAYLSSSVEAPLKTAIAELLKTHTDMANLEQQITTAHDQMGEYRARMDELHAQIVTLRAVKSSGNLVQHLEKKLSEVSDKLSQATLDLVALQEKLMVARIRFQDGIAELSLEKKGA